MNGSKLSPSEAAFREGLELCRAKRYPEAFPHLETALALLVDEPQARHGRLLRSFYGMALAVVRGDLPRSRRLCEEAIADGPMDADLYCNLARVYSLMGKRQLAVESIATALSVNPAHGPSLQLQREIGRRRRPVLPFLSRDNPLNIALGRMRHRMLG